MLRPGVSVLCIRSHSHNIVRQGGLYLIQGVRPAPCSCHSGNLVNVGIPDHSLVSKGRCACGVVYESTDDFHWLSASLFVPVYHDGGMHHPYQHLQEAKSTTASNQDEQELETEGI